MLNQKILYFIRKYINLNRDIIFGVSKLGDSLESTTLLYPILSDDNEGTRAHFVFLQGGPFGKLIELEIDSQSLKIGRDPTCDIQLDHSSISRIHAKLSLENCKYIIEDQSSTNGTYINEIKIEEAVEILCGDIIKFGSVVLKFLSAGSAEVPYLSGLYTAANKDPLTKLYNRRYFEENAHRALKISARTNKLVSLLVFDLDNFKNINDTYGHSIGDIVLSRVSERLLDCVRAEDLLARVGGEEFVLLLPEATHEGAVRLAERILRTVREVSFLDVSGPKLVTISIGISFLDYSSLSYFGSDLKKIFDEADKALYRSKENGRNQITVM